MQITETVNTGILLKGVQAKNDCEIKGLEAPLQSYNFFYGIIGGPGSGKTSLWLNLITTKGKYYYKKFDKIFIFSSSIHTITKKIDLEPERFYNGLDWTDFSLLLETIKESEDRVLLIFDDVISSIQKNIKPFLNLVYNRRHIGGGCSLMLVSQVFNKIPLEVRKVMSGVFLFTTRNKRELDSFFEDYISYSRDDFSLILKKCFDTKHSFIYIDTTTDTIFHNFNKLTISL